MIVGRTGRLRGLGWHFTQLPFALSLSKGAVKFRGTSGIAQRLTGALRQAQGEGFLYASEARSALTLRAAITNLLGSNQRWRL